MGREVKEEEDGGSRARGRMEVENRCAAGSVWSWRALWRRLQPAWAHRLHLKPSALEIASLVLWILFRLPARGVRHTHMHTHTNTRGGDSLLKISKYKYESHPRTLKETPIM